MNLSAKLVILFLILSQSALALDLRKTDDPRYCGEPPRNAKGEIIRNQTELRKFKAIYPCEDFAYKFGTTCSDWQIDHIIPLNCGGCDKIYNYQWLPKNIKTCSQKSNDKLCKDRFESSAYCPDGGFHR